jgi:hypothetical protein
LDFDRDTLLNHWDSDDDPERRFVSNNGALNTLERAGSNPNGLSYCKVVGFWVPEVQPASEDLNLPIANRVISRTSTDNAYHARRSQDQAPHSGRDTSKKISWE